MRSTWRRHLGALGLYLALTLLLTWPLVRSLGSAIPGDAFDGWQNYWNLWWVRKALLELRTHPYFTPTLYFPTGVALWFQTLNIFNGLSSLPVQLASNLLGAYNGVVLFSFAAAGYGAMLLALHGLRQAGARPGWQLWAAAFLAGAIYTFSPFHFAHLLGHMQVFSLTFIPFYALYLLRALPPTGEKTARKNAWLAGLFLILAGLCDWYFALYLGLFTTLYVLGLMARRRFSRAHLSTLALTWGIFLLAMSPLLAPMVVESVRYDFMRPPAGQIETLSADVLGFILPSGQHPVWGEWAARMRSNLSASPSENTVYAGVTVLALATYALRRRRLRLGFWALTALVFALFALGPVLHMGGQTIRLSGQPLPLPYALLLRLPFFDIARTVARYDLIVMLALGLLAGGGLYVALETRPSRWLVLAALGLVLFEFAPLPYPLSPPDTPPWYRTLAADPRPGAVLNLPANWDRPGYLLYQTVHGKSLTAGYISRDDPRTLPTRIPVLSDFRHLRSDINAVDPAAFAPTIFDFLGIRWVVIDRYKMPGGNEREITDALVSSIFAGRSPAYADDRITVYETWPPDQPLPFIELGFDWGPLAPDGTRHLSDKAAIIIHSPAELDTTLVVTPAASSAAPLSLEDAGGQPLPSVDNGGQRWQFRLRPGPNRFILTTGSGDARIQRLTLSSTDENEEQW